MINRGRGVTVRAYHTDDSPTEVNRTGQTFIAVAIEAGWPLRSLRAETKYLASCGWTESRFVFALRPWPNARGLPIARDLPLGPLWGGLLLNAVLFALALWLLFEARGVIRRRWRRRHHHCDVCGYPAGTSAVCTECGTALHHRVRGKVMTRD